MNLKRWFGYREGSRGHNGIMETKQADKSRNFLSNSSSSSVGLAALEVEDGGLGDDRREKNKRGLDYG
jgi:hypothetical protein